MISVKSTHEKISQFLTLIGTYVFWEFIFTLFIAFFTVIVQQVTGNMGEGKTVFFWVHKLLLKFGSFTLNIVFQEFPDLIFDSSSLFVISKGASVFCFVSGKVLKWWRLFDKFSTYIIIWNSKFEKLGYTSKGTYWWTFIPTLVTAWCLSQFWIFSEFTVKRTFGPCPDGTDFLFAFSNGPFCNWYL